MRPTSVTGQYHMCVSRKNLNRAGPPSHFRPSRGNDIAQSFPRTLQRSNPRRTVLDQGRRYDLGKQFPGCVTRIGCRVVRTRCKTAKHFALNSDMAISSTLKAPDPMRTIVIILVNIYDSARREQSHSSQTPNSCYRATMRARYWSPVLQTTSPKF